jgi:glutaconate CoA-transferase subunit A
MKVTTMREAIGSLVADGDTVALEGFTHLISFAAAHELTRQERRRLTLSRLTPDLVADMLVAAGVVDRLVFSWLGNPGVGSLHAVRRRIEAGSLEWEEYTHFAMVARYQAGAAGLPFLPIRSFTGSDLPAVNPALRRIADPYGGEDVWVVPALTPDVAIVAVQRADPDGNAQVWGLLGCQREAAFAARRVIVVCEELVDPDVVRRDPNRTIIPGLKVDAVVVEPGGCHPSFAQGYYDRDNAFYLEWDEISRDPGRLEGWLDQWVRSTDDHRAYLARLGERWERLAPARSAPSGEVDYGWYT